MNNVFQDYDCWNGIEKLKNTLNFCPVFAFSPNAHALTDCKNEFFVMAHLLSPTISNSMHTITLLLFRFFKFSTTRFHEILKSLIVF